MTAAGNDARQPLVGMDAALLELETPTNLMVINAVMILAAPVSLDALKTVIAERLLSTRRFRQRVMPAAGLFSMPFWEDDPGFDINHHVHRIILSQAEGGGGNAAPDPSSPEAAPQAALQDVVGKLASTPLDLSRPPWAFYLVEGYGSGSALICRIHHSIGDGVSLVQVLLSISDSACLVPPGASASAGTSGSQDARDTEPVAQTAGRGGRRARARRLLRKGLSLARHPSRLARATRSAGGVASALGDILLSLPDSRTAFKGRLGVSKRVAWSGPVPLDQVKAIGRAMRGTVNDVLLSAMAGALRRYLQGRGDEPDWIDLHAAVPVNLRPADGHDQAPGAVGELGNRVGTVFLRLPVDVADPGLRLQKIRRAMDGLKESYQAPATFAAMQGLGFAPGYLQQNLVHLLSGKATAIVTNVIGPRETRYLAGAPVDSLLFWVPKTGGLALGISILSYAGQVRIGVITDEGLAPDPDAIVARFEDEIAELVALAHEASIVPTMQDLVAMLDEALAGLESMEVSPK